MRDQGDRPAIVEAEARTRLGNGTGPTDVAGERPLLLDAEALGHELGISIRMVRRLDQRGELPQPVLIGRAVRWRREELVAWIDAGCPPRSRWHWPPAED